MRLLHLDTMKQVSMESLGGDVIPRSILMCKFEGLLYLLVALGDGTLLYFRLDASTGEMLDKKKVTLGTQPTILRTFQSR